MITSIIITFWIGFFIGLGTEKIKSPSDNIILKVLLLLFAPFFYTLLLLWDIIEEIVKWINGKTQIQFFFTFYFTKKWNNKSHEYCENLSRRAIISYSGFSWHNRLFRYCAYLVNKRNHHYKEYYNPKTGAVIKKPKEK